MIPLPPFVAKLAVVREDLKDFEHRLLVDDGVCCMFIRSPLKYPDIVNDVEKASERVGLEDLKDVDFTCLLGEKENVGIDPKLLRVLVKRRLWYENKMVTALRSRLTVYDSERFKDAASSYGALGFGIRVPDVKNYQRSLHKIDIPEDVSAVYIFDNAGYLKFGAHQLKGLMRLQSKESTIEVMKRKLEAADYELITIEGFDIAAKKRVGNIRRVLARYYDYPTLYDLQRTLEDVVAYNADVGFVLSSYFAPELRRVALGTKLELVEAKDIEALYL